MMEVELSGTTTVNIGELLIPDEMVQLLGERFNTPVAEWSLGLWEDRG